MTVASSDLLLQERTSLGQFLLTDRALKRLEDDQQLSLSSARLCLDYHIIENFHKRLASA